MIKLIDDIEKVKVDEEEIETFLPGIYRKLEWLSKEDLIKRVVSMEFNRFLDYYKNAAEIEQPKGNEKEKAKRNGKIMEVIAKRPVVKPRKVIHVCSLIWVKRMVSMPIRLLN